MVAIVIKSNYPKTGSVTVEFGDKVKELKALDYDKLKPKAVSKDDFYNKLRTNIENLFNDRSE